MATLSQRWQVVRFVLDQVAAALPDVDIQPCWLADGAPEMVFPGEIAGTLNVPVMQAGRHQRDDEFDVTWEIRAAKPGQDPDDAQTRYERIAAAFDDLCADHSTLYDLDSVVEASFTDEKSYMARTADGVVVYGQAVTHFHCRYL
jgi:hypothetical protein